MKKFIYLRLLIIFIGGSQAVYKVSSQDGFVKSYSEPAITWKILPLFFIFSIIGTLFVISLQKSNPRTKKQWTKPSWHSNPFNFGNPVDFFHLAGIFFVITGVVDICSNYIKFGQINMEGFIALITGTGVLVALKLVEIFYKEKFSKE